MTRRAILTPEKVREIRKTHLAYVRGYKRIAKQLGVGETTVRDVVTFRTWRHVYD